MGENRRTTYTPGIAKDMYMLSYNHIIYSVSDENQWIKTNYDPVESPFVRTQPGRQKKLRRRGQDKLRNNGTRMEKTGIPMKCLECKQLGHGKRTCPRRNVATRRHTSMSALVAPHVVEESIALATELGLKYESQSVVYSCFFHVFV